MPRRSSSSKLLLASTFLWLFSACGGKDDAAGQPPTIASGATVAPQATQPAASEPGPAIAEQATYVVEAGDTLSEIAAALGVDLEALISANAIEDPDLIFPGQTLLVPAE